MVGLIQTDRMLPIALIISQQEMHRSLVGAVASDPVVLARTRHARRATPTRQASRARDERGASPYSCARENTQTA
jgi:hypothetical protein